MMLSRVKMKEEHVDVSEPANVSLDSTHTQN